MSAVEIPQRVLDRFWTRVQVGEPGDCWPWTLSTGSHGYGQVGWWDKHHAGSRMVLTHRVAWQLAHGPIVDDLTVDHMCRNRLCCNPLHLRLLTNEANASDNGQKRRTHCPSGHPYADENLYVDPDGHRSCRMCARLRSRTRGVA